MNFLEDLYKKSFLESERNIKFWEEYLEKLNSLDFNIYSDKLTVPILVPIGNKILFRGLLKHTNEVTAALGADYFAKCSTKQAEVLRLHRINDVRSKLEILKKERDYLENQISFSKDEVQDQDVIEVCSEEEDRAWREKHKEKVKQYYQNRRKTESENTEISDEDLLLRLEELELQEELRNELADINGDEEFESPNNTEYDSFIIKEDDVSNIDKECTNYEELDARITRHIPKQTSKLDLLQQVYERQKMLEEKLSEIKNRERVQSTTENDLLSRIDEIEQLDDLEDEMNRLDDIIDDDESEINDDSTNVENDNNITKITRSVTFADHDENETIEIAFKHSSIEPSMQPYNPDKGITTPNDIYQAFSYLFVNDTTSILKKSKYNDDGPHLQIKHTNEAPQSANDIAEVKTIVIQDVTEKIDHSENKPSSDGRPMSLFKRKRQQK